MSYANKLSSFEHSFLLRATTAHAHAGRDPCREGYRSADAGADDLEPARDHARGGPLAGP